MRFTRRTYKLAIKRSLKKEYELFGEVQNTHAWYLQMLHTAALEARQLRETA